jgi:hypothetical protein
LPTGTGKQNRLPNPDFGTRKAANQQQHSVSHPLFGERVPRRHLRGLDEHEKAGLLTPRSSYRPRLTALSCSGSNGAFVARYSGATARDSHPFPYSPPVVTGGTLSRKPLNVVVVSKNFSTNSGDLRFPSSKKKRLSHGARLLPF